MMRGTPWLAVLVSSLLHAPYAVAAPINGALSVIGGPTNEVGAEVELGSELLPLRVGARYAPYWRDGYIASGWGLVEQAILPGSKVGVLVGYCGGETIIGHYAPGVPESPRPIGRWYIGASFDQTWDRLVFRFSPNLTVVPPDASRPDTQINLWESFAGLGQPWVELGYRVTPWFNLSLASRIPVPVKATVVF